MAAFHALDLQFRRTNANDAGSDELAALEVRHQEFHRALIGNCRSRRLTDLADQLYAETQRYRLPALTGRSAKRDIPAEHKGIMEAALERRAEDAIALLAEHYRRTSQFLEVNMLPHPGQKALSQT